MLEQGARQAALRKAERDLSHLAGLQAQEEDKVRRAGGVRSELLEELIEVRRGGGGRGRTKQQGQQSGGSCKRGRRRDGCWERAQRACTGWQCGIGIGMAGGCRKGAHIVPAVRSEAHVDGRRVVRLSSFAPPAAREGCPE